MKWLHGLCLIICLFIGTAKTHASVGLSANYTFVAKDNSQSSLPDTIIPFKPEPTRAAFLSALVPGLGQIYNQQYWHLAFVYAIGTAAIIHYRNTSTKFNQYRDIYINKKDGLISNDTPLTKSYTEQQLESLMDRWTSERDRAIAFIVIAYLINVGDAFVGAHLFDFGDFDNLFSFDFDLNRDFNPMLALRFEF